MPRTSIPVTVPTRAGTAIAAPTVGDTANNHTVANNGATMVEVSNSGATSHTVTFRFARMVDGQEITPRPLSIAAGASRLYGPFDVNDYGAALNIDVDHAELALRAYSL